MPWPFVSLWFNLFPVTKSVPHPNFSWKILSLECLLPTRLPILVGKNQPCYVTGPASENYRRCLGFMNILTQVFCSVSQPSVRHLLWLFEISSARIIRKDSVYFTYKSCKFCNATMDGTFGTCMYILVKLGMYSYKVIIKVCVSTCMCINSTLAALHTCIGRFIIMHGEEVTIRWVQVPDMYTVVFCL